MTGHNRYRQTFYRPPGGGPVDLLSIKNVTNYNAHIYLLGKRLYPVYDYHATEPGCAGKLGYPNLQYSRSVVGNLHSGLESPSWQERYAWVGFFP